MNNITVPSFDTVSPDNQAVFEKLESMLGFVPNMYAVMAHSPTALADYLSLQNRKNSLTAKERELVNLLVSELNGCNYCRAAHTTISKMVGFSEPQTIEIRKAQISFDDKLNALASLTKEIVSNKGDVSANTLERFYAAGYSHENLIDLVLNIGDKIITNYLFALTKVPIDFPLAQPI